MAFNPSSKYFELNPISISSPSFFAEMFSFTLPASDCEVIDKLFSLNESFMRLFLPSFANKDALSILSIRLTLSICTVVANCGGSSFLYSR